MHNFYNVCIKFPFCSHRNFCKCFGEISFLLLSSGAIFLLVKPVEAMGLDLLPILPRALPSGSAVAVVGQRARS
jgi:hypothetical protein